MSARDFYSRMAWRRGSESNRRIKVLQTSPLPLGYRAPAQLNSVPSRCITEHEASWKQRNLERETGFEPATSTLARSHSTAELLPLSKGYCTIGLLNPELPATSGQGASTKEIRTNNCSKVSTSLKFREIAAPSPRLFLAQRIHGIDARRPTRRNIHG